jgi:hypothetical protein
VLGFVFIKILAARLGLFCKVYVSIKGDAVRDIHAEKVN